MSDLATNEPDLANSAVIQSETAAPLAAGMASRSVPTVSAPTCTDVQIGAALQPTSAYGLSFWFAYVSNFLTMASLAMLVRYSDFVLHLGGTEQQLGWIVGVGAVGSMCTRLLQGRGIDRLGARPIWILSLVILVLSLLANLFVTSAYSVPIFLLRCLAASSTAGIFSAAMTFVSRKAPPERMAEMIGTLGTAGFGGMLVGPMIGDAICGSDGLTRLEINLLFVVAAGSVALAGVFAILAAWRDTPPVATVELPVLSVIREFQPGALLAMSAVAGAGLNLPLTFLRPFAQSLDIPTVWIFFTIYGLSALAGRVISRRWPERLGNYVCTILGTLLLVTAFCCLAPVRTSFHMIPAALALGGAHALLFPAVIAGISTAFPAKHRGIGTTLALMFFDAGTLIGAPLAGTLLYLAKRYELPMYPTMFVVMGSIFTAAGMAYAMIDRRYWYDFVKLVGGLKRQFSQK